MHVWNVGWMAIWRHLGNFVWKWGNSSQRVHNYGDPDGFSGGEEAQGTRRRNHMLVRGMLLVSMGRLCWIKLKTNHPLQGPYCWLACLLVETNPPPRANMILSWGAEFCPILKCPFWSKYVGHEGCLKGIPPSTYLRIIIILFRHPLSSKK